MSVPPALSSKVGPHHTALGAQFWHKLNICNSSIWCENASCASPSASRLKFMSIRTCNLVTLKKVFAFCLNTPLAPKQELALAQEENKNLPCSQTTIWKHEVSVSGRSAAANGLFCLFFLPYLLVSCLMNTLITISHSMSYR